MTYGAYIRRESGQYDLLARFPTLVGAQRAARKLSLTTPDSAVKVFRANALGAAYGHRLAAYRNGEKGWY